jgi:hypothetical protein
MTATRKSSFHLKRQRCPWNNWRVSYGWEYSFAILLFATAAMVVPTLLCIMAPATLRYSGPFAFYGFFGFISVWGLIYFYPVLGILDFAIGRGLASLGLQNLNGLVYHAMNPWGYLGNAWLSGGLIGFWLFQRIKQRTDTPLNWAGE